MIDCARVSNFSMKKSHLRRIDYIQLYSIVFKDNHTFMIFSGGQVRPGQESTTIDFECWPDETWPQPSNIRFSDL